METVLAQEQKDSLVEGFLDMCSRQVERWIEGCYQFRRWERVNIIERKADAETIAKHKKALSGMIRGTRLMLSMASDPESFDSKTYRTLLTLVEQLQHSWDMLYKVPTPEESAEIEKLIREVFPT